MSARKADRPTYPEKILPTVRSDIRAYLRHGYTFADFKDRNTHGRNYGEELRPIWDEVSAQYGEAAAAVRKLIEEA